MLLENSDHLIFKAGKYVLVHRRNAIKLSPLQNVEPESTELPIIKGVNSRAECIARRAKVLYV